MRWIKKEYSLKLSRTEGRSKGKLIQNFERPSKLADKVIWQSQRRESVATLWVSTSFKSRWQNKWCTDMKELFIITYRRLVPSKFKEEIDEKF